MIKEKASICLVNALDLASSAVRAAIRVWLIIPLEGV
jgi:hypothetical protein